MARGTLDGGTRVDPIIQVILLAVSFQATCICSSTQQARLSRPSHASSTPASCFSPPPCGCASSRPYTYWARNKDSQGALLWHLSQRFGAAGVPVSHCLGASSVSVSQCLGVSVSRCPGVSPLGSVSWASPPPHSPPYTRVSVSRCLRVSVSPSYKKIFRTTTYLYHIYIYRL